VVRNLLVLFALLVVASALIAAWYRQHEANAPVDRIVVQKSARTLSTFRHGKKQKSYRVALGGNPVGPKEEEGDRKTPEGIYHVDARKADSDYHLALHLSYPSPDDLARAAQHNISAGCDIEIHGLPNGHGPFDHHPARDWTAGCIALTDAEIEELWRVAPVGTIVEIEP
jgi:murein L,D-transpeptidase YafK